ncbi:hypothetical protein SPRG_12940 [Saprolegnia parasitica CBS 223.65]|uniref:Uncharacterized protein n=1 Tax=Saprolegnia parasitica (strain CBS 223.65) TaxID=695850 RepID=A0A067BRP5_SAPPC|nr:hypothetical protein SPRG_12940 [Saprolegnia parasitica CBS 223.65]KDO21159.1 hypothetical protein SPRG_12940 [Saprolegnia parasitica CBS 223.65]|eukprot:XP_012208158.1 hypothetical protein SPRG_12940 [Saprolegnia parasitica CBS 223.65]
MSHRSQRPTARTPHVSARDRVDALVGAATSDACDRPIEADLERRLRAAFSPHTLRIENLSLRQLQRRVLGPKRYWYQSIKLETVSQLSAKKWKVQIYYAPWRRSVAEWFDHPRSRYGKPSRPDQLAPTLVGTFEHEKAARAACAKAVKARDRLNPVSLSNDPSAPAPPHWNAVFGVTLVSDAFQRLPLLHRLELVYSALLDCDGCVPLHRCRKLSYIGDHVRRLPCFGTIAVELHVVCRTVAQHDAAAATLALTERLGLSHAHVQSAGVDPTAKTSLRDVAALVDDTQAPTRVPHFYHGLPQALKDLLAQEQAALYREHHALGKDADVHAVVHRYEKRMRALSLAAIKIQRLFRQQLHSRVLRRLLRRHRHAITLQRVYRGYRARVFTTELFLVSTFAATHIQAAYRSSVSRHATRVLRAHMVLGAVGLQRLFRGHRARKWVFWMRYHVANAIQIQRCVRGLFGRRRAKMFRHAQFKRHVQVPAASLLQRVYRGHVGRGLYRRAKAEHARRVIHTPAAIAIQRVFRGGRGRARFRQLELQRAMASTLQRAYRAYRNRVVWAGIFEQRRRNLLASRIGAAGRGFLARLVLRRERRKVHLKTVVGPSTRLIQRIFRGYMVRKRLEDFRDRHEAACVIQFAWRQAKRAHAERVAWEAKLLGLQHAAASTVQCLVRQFLARKHVTARRMAQRGRYGAAAVKVQAAWRSFQSRQQCQAMRDLLRIEVKARAMTTFKDELEMVQFDYVDASADLARLAKYKKKALQHIHDLKQMRLDWELRAPFVDKELASMTPEDVGRGWAEAFETEKVVIHFSRLLSAEEILSKRQQIREYDHEIEALQMELEDLERDRDEFLMDETLEIEGLRRLELSRALGLYDADTKTAVRRQRVRWKVRNVRRNVLLRKENARLRALLPPASPSASLSYATNVAHARASTDLLRATVAAAAADRSLALEASGSRNPQVLATYDAIVRATKAIVDETSLAMRLPKRDVREDLMCHTCGRMACICHLPLVAPSNQAELHVGGKPKKAPPVKLGRRRKGHHDASIPRMDPNAK